MGVLVNRESGGNVFAINTTDSNAAASNASRGLAQVIPTTFNAFHQIGTPWDIYDPVANLAASINWIKYKYGSIANVQQANPNLPPKGYSFGGIVPRGGGTHDSGGWLEHGQLGLNMSGTPEAVLTGPDYALMRAAAVANNRGLGIGDVHVYVGDREIEDIVRVELRDFSGAVVGALDDGRGDRWPSRRTCSARTTRPSTARSVRGRRAATRPPSASPPRRRTPVRAVCG